MRSAFLIARRELRGGVQKSSVSSSGPDTVRGMSNELLFDFIALRLNHEKTDGMDFVPTSKGVLFGHHFAAIAGAGPLVGPVLAAQMGVGGDDSVGGLLLLAHTHQAESDGHSELFSLV